MLIFNRNSQMYHISVSLSIVLDKIDVKRSFLDMYNYRNIFC